VVNLSSIRPLDRQGVIQSLRKTGLALTVEEHSLHGGVGSLVSGITAEEGLACRVKRLGFAEANSPCPDHAVKCGPMPALMRRASSMRPRRCCSNRNESGAKWAN
jgi:pyruvate/2-oxoglutarate/acetoin dehydrogenase E1 component